MHQTQSVIITARKYIIINMRMSETKYSQQYRILILDFLGLQDTYSEKDLENAILAELEKFILEMGTDFAFMARQKKVTIDGKDYKIDLLFFHRKLKRLVVVELKIGEFEPEYKAQVELYLRWLNKYERMENEEAPIALILCAEKSDEVIELLELDKADIQRETEHTIRSWVYIRIN